MPSASQSPIEEIARTLIGSIDRKNYFDVGEKESYTCTAEGRLFLGINDKGLTDNSGKFIATI
jgi:hypothetical protein